MTNQQWLARVRPPEFGSNHGLVWLIFDYSRGQPIVGRVLFNPPLQARWRVKESPPYTSWVLIDVMVRNQTGEKVATREATVPELMLT